MTNLLGRFELLAMIRAAMTIQTGLSRTRVSPATARVTKTRGMASHVRSECPANDTIHLTVFEAIWDMLARGNKEIHGVKIDVQGMGMAALRGTHRSLRSSRAKLVEIHPGVDRRELLSTVADLGYNPIGVAIDPLPGEVIPGYHDDHSYAFTPD